MPRNKSNHKPPVAERVRLRKAAKDLAEALRKDTILERSLQAEIIEGLKQNNGGEVTPAAAYEVLAMRRQAVRAL